MTELRVKTKRYFRATAVAGVLLMGTWNSRLSYYTLEQIERLSTRKDRDIIVDDANDVPVAIRRSARHLGTALRVWIAEGLEFDAHRIVERRLGDSPAG